MTNEKQDESRPSMRLGLLFVQRKEGEKLPAGVAPKASRENLGDDAGGTHEELSSGPWVEKSLQRWLGAEGEKL